MVIAARKVTENRVLSPGTRDLDSLLMVATFSYTYRLMFSPSLLPSLLSSSRNVFCQRMTCSFFERRRSGGGGSIPLQSFIKSNVWFKVKENCAYGFGDCVEV